MTCKCKAHEQLRERDEELRKTRLELAYANAENRNLKYDNAHLHSHVDELTRMLESARERAQKAQDELKRMLESAAMMTYMTGTAPVATAAAPADIAAFGDAFEAAGHSK